MGAVLFKLFGFDVTWKVLLRVGIGIGAAVVIYLSYNAVSDHFQHIRDLETENESLKEKVTRVEGQRDAVIEINRQNQAAADLEDDIDDNNQQIAAAERAAERERAETYREIRNVIQSSPEPSSSRDEQPVAPVIADTFDRLWGNAPAGAGSSGSDPGGDGFRGAGPGTP